MQDQIPSVSSATAAPCPNCGDTTPGRYCPACGQARRLRVVSLREMLVDFLDDQLSLSSRLPRTAAFLLSRPGYLTTEYLRGRIASYIRPLRLYLGASVVFFLLLSLDSGWMEFNVGEGAVTDGGTTPALQVPAIPADAPVDPEVRARVASAQETAARVREATAMLPGGTSWVDQIDYEFGNPALQRLLEDRKNHFRGMTPREAVREVGSEFREHIPTTMFLLLPAFAFLLKLLYARRRRLYVEHFVFALHLHAFAFALFTLMLLVPYDRVGGALVVWMLLYTFLAMKRVYGQSLVKTGVKYAVLGFSYSVLLSVALAVTAVVTLLIV